MYSVVYSVVYMDAKGIVEKTFTNRQQAYIYYQMCLKQALMSQGGVTIYDDRGIRIVGMP